MFHRLLIANRGEIACRIIRTARRMGLHTIAVYSEADAGALHVQMADEGVLIGPAPAPESYLSIEAIIEAAIKTGAQAVHPGYGFLSENAGFAEACAEAGLVFVGPPPEAIEAMGLKDRAKAIMAESGVPIVPGYHEVDQDPDRLAGVADKIGYPVLIKAVAGGGGRGMRRVEERDKFEKQLAAARREAKNAFGNDHVLIEKCIEVPRHIEVQVMADSQGHTVHLFERDCSLQRRHQKVVEEAPAPGMPESMRAAMGEAAVRAARAIGYRGAGTVEFIVDAANGLAEDTPFYFMEMNTRLQVEHPVTEMITGLDLVEWQLRIAGGEAFPFAQDELALDGHAIEVRLYAEDPAKKFLPRAGHLDWFQPPEETTWQRTDTGFRSGDDITPYYDPMIAKIIVHADARDEALLRLSRALDETHVSGLATNLDFLRSVATHAPFAAAEIDTGFIDRHLDELAAPPAAPAPEELALGALGLILSEQAAQKSAAVVSPDPHTPWASADGWWLNWPSPRRMMMSAGDGDPVECFWRMDGAAVELDVAGRIFRADRASLGGGELSACLDRHNLSAGFRRVGEGYGLFLPGREIVFSRYSPAQQAGAGLQASGDVRAPLPGRIVSLAVSAGEDVGESDPLLVLEAMKMEYTLRAPCTGTVDELAAAPGDQVREGQLLVRIVRNPSSP